MSVKDIASNIKVSISLAPVVIATNVVTTGIAIDNADFGEGLCFAAKISAFTDGVYKLGAVESDDNVTFTAVPAEKIIGASSQNAATGSNAFGKIGVFANKRYVKATVTSTGVTTGATVEVIAIQAGEYLPVV